MAIGKLKERVSTHSKFTSTIDNVDVYISKNGCSFRSGEKNIDFSVLPSSLPYQPLNVIQLKPEQTHLLPQNHSFAIHCLTGDIKIHGTNTCITLTEGEFVIWECPPIKASVIQSSRQAQHYVAITDLHTAPQLPASNNEAFKLINVHSFNYAQRPNGIILKSLLMGTCYEQTTGYEYVEMPPNQLITPHVHPNSDAIVIVTQGSGRFIAGNGSVQVKRWSHGIIPRGKLHGVIADAYGMTFISVQIPPIGEDGYIFFPDFVIPAETVELE
ncbi:cupin domain-containing protein [Zooshikella ganghwensis]|uniref:cupin domain-containing protein n=1 Tax=Zooshikella ganghwensis TaxID=202772 RepID=UPI0003FAD6C8|nr:cupin domain-containing protein [Zooshikella ganghwensis]